jgi:purine-nucleoside phosphorylase
MFSNVKETANFIKEKIKNKTPRIGVILGSGLGDFADEVENRIEIPYSEIPHFHATTVVGHAGRVVYGTIAGVEVIVFQGRFHAYEGHSFEDVVLPARVTKLLGATELIVTNAAGGINSDYSPGELVYLSDHINLTSNNPLIGKNDDEQGPRFPDMSEAYSKNLNQILEKAAKEQNIKLFSGVYAGLRGPSYETPAEIRYLRIIGADMVGMSTVPEVIAANHMGLKVCAISCITNLAAGISTEKLNHDEVKEVANMSMQKFKSLLTTSIKLIGEQV